jgi:hypothetical protein
MEIRIIQYKELKLGDELKEIYSHDILESIL